jgi:hypothetical protein
MKKLIYFILSVSVMAMPVLAQFVEQESHKPEMTLDAFGASPAATPFSLLDLSRINWSHSYSVTYFSGGLGSGTMGLFRTNMAYDFSPKLSLFLNVGIAHNPGALWGDKRNNDTQLLPGFLLDYHPSDKFRMSLGFQKFGGSNVYPYYYDRGLFSDW